MTKLNAPERITEELKAKADRTPEEQRAVKAVQMRRRRAKRTPEECARDAADNAEWWKANPEKRRAKANKWVRANPEKRREHGQRAWAKLREVNGVADREHERLARRAWEAANPAEHAAQVREYHRNWRAAHPQATADATEKWRAANPSAPNLWSAKRRARLAQVLHVPYVDAEVFDRDDYYCQHCGIKTNRDGDYRRNSAYPNKDHIIPISRGGHDALYNLQTLCSACNCSKGARLDKYAERN